MSFFENIKNLGLNQKSDPSRNYDKTTSYEDSESVSAFDDAAKGVADSETASIFNGLKSPSNYPRIASAGASDVSSANNNSPFEYMFETECPNKGYSFEYIGDENGFPQIQDAAGNVLVNTGRSKQTDPNLDGYNGHLNNAKHEILSRNSRGQVSFALYTKIENGVEKIVGYFIRTDDNTGYYFVYPNKGSVKKSDVYNVTANDSGKTNENAGESANGQTNSATRKPFNTPAPAQEATPTPTPTPAPAQGAGNDSPVNQQFYEIMNNASLSVEDKFNKILELASNNESGKMEFDSALLYNTIMTIFKDGGDAQNFVSFMDAYTKLTCNNYKDFTVDKDKIDGFLDILINIISEENGFSAAKACQYFNLPYFCNNSSDPKNNMIRLFEAACNDVSEEKFENMPDNLTIENLLSMFENRNYENIPSGFMRDCLAKMINKNPEEFYKQISNLKPQRKVNALYMIASGESIENVKYYLGGKEIPANNPNYLTLSKLGVSNEGIAKSEYIGDDTYKLSDQTTLKVVGNKVECYDKEGNRDLNKEIQINLVNNTNISLSDKIAYIESLAEEFEGMEGLYNSTQFNNIFQSIYDAGCKTEDLTRVIAAYQKLTGYNPQRMSEQLGSDLKNAAKFGNEPQLEIFINELADIIQKEGNAQNILNLDSVLSVMDMTFGNDEYPDALGKLFMASYKFLDSDEKRISEDGSRDFYTVKQDFLDFNYDATSARANILNAYDLYEYSEKDRWTDMCMGFYNSIDWETGDETHKYMHALYRLLLGEGCGATEEFLEKFYQ